MSGHLFWNLPLIYQEVLNSLREARIRLEAQDASLTSVGIDTWGCDVAYFYADGTPAGLPYCYRDPHTTGAVDDYASRMGREELYERTGIQFMDFNTLFQLDTLRRTGAEVLDAADKILFMPDALVYMLTGRAVTEFTVASTSQMLNLATGDFDPVLLLSLGLERDKFGPMVSPATVIGTLTPEVMRHTGLGDDVKVIAVAGHDTASAVIGIPTADDAYAYLSCGTWALLGVESAKSNSGPKALEYNFTNEGASTAPHVCSKTSADCGFSSECAKSWVCATPTSPRLRLRVTTRSATQSLTPTTPRLPIPPRWSQPSTTIA